jgi:phage RecT family recombinase
MGEIKMGAKDLVDTVGKGYHRLVPEKFRSEFFWQREKQHLLALIQRAPELLECDPDSLARAVSNAGAMGLSLNPVLGHCYIIKRNERKKAANESWDQYKATVGSIAYCCPSYMGMADLAVKSERIMQVTAEVVFDADTFRYFGPMDAPTHEAVHRSVDRTYDKAVGVYAVARLREKPRYATQGVFQTVYLDRSMIERIRALSETPNSIMWDPEKLWTEGWKKAAVRRLWKLLPKTPAMIAAMEVSDEIDGPVVIDELAPDGMKAEKAVVIVNDEDVRGLIQMLTDGGIKEEELNRWRERLSLRFAIGRLDELPKDELPKARELIKTALAERAAKKAGRVT